MSDGVLFLVPDNTVLVNFAFLHRMDLLRSFAGGSARATWCATVARECHASSRRSGLEDLTEAPGIFGEPLVPDSPAEHSTIRVYKTMLDRPGDGPLSNLGEAESLAILECRSLRAIFVTDDHGARDIAESRLDRRRFDAWLDE